MASLVFWSSAALAFSWFLFCKKAFLGLVYLNIFQIILLLSWIRTHLFISHKNK